MKIAERLQLLRSHDLTLGSLLQRLAEIHGDRRLVEEHSTGLTLTYAQGAARVARMAAGIAGKVSPGDRVVVGAPNGYEFFLLCLAASRAGAIPVPVNPQMTPNEVDYVVGDSDAHLVVRTPGEVEGRDELATAVPAAPDDLAAIFYTSGTTGKPKGARLSHRALVGSAGMGGLSPASLRSDEFVSGMPVAHIAGFSMLIMGAALGVPVYLLPRFRPNEALDAIESRRSSVFVGVPAMYRMMLEAGAEQRDLKCVRMWASGADAVPDDLIKTFKRFGATVKVPFTGRTVGQATFVDGYGMVELAGGVAVRVSLPGVDLPLMALPGFKLRSIDEHGNEVARGEVGELAVKGPGVMGGYHGKDEATAEVLTPEGWLRTGDLARVHRFGLVSLAGRMKHVIKHGGYSVFAVEVEHTLEEHPEVAEASVIGLPDERKGELPAAVVRLAPGSSLTPEGLVAWAKEHMAGYKVPVHVRVVDELPRTGTHKVQKDKLLELFDSL